MSSPYETVRIFVVYEIKIQVSLDWAVLGTVDWVQHLLAFREVELLLENPQEALCPMKHTAQIFKRVGENSITFFSELKFLKMGLRVICGESAVTILIT